MTEGNYHYFLDFTTSPHKYSYAASFGTTILEKKYHDQSRQLLKQFAKISLREESGNVILQELIGKNSAIVCDPTFLLTEKEWRQLAVTPKTSKRYILIFMFCKNYDLLECAKKYVTSNGCSIYNIAYSQKIKGAKNFYHVPPERWLGLIDQAEAVFTDSLHGFALSLNFNKKVCVSISDQTRGCRISDVAKRYNATACLLPSNEAPYSSPEIQAAIQKDRNKGKKYLQDIVNESRIPNK